MRIQLPASNAPSGVLMDIHGGGFGGRRRRPQPRTADALGIAVVSVDYRLAPENPWPAAPDDCEPVALWFAEHAVERHAAPCCRPVPPSR